MGIEPRQDGLSRTGARIVDLFAGPGGLDVAATWLGLDSVGVELDPDAIATRRAAGLRTRPGDVRDVVPDDFPGCTVLAAGPPCQTFTVAGRGSGRLSLDLVLDLVGLVGERRIDQAASATEALDDQRTGLVLQPLIWAMTARWPYSAIVLEQVPAVLPVWEAMADVLRDQGYGVATGVLNAEQFGVPQTRRRAVLIARLGAGDREVSLPKPTHKRFRGVDDTAGLLDCVTMGDALPNLGDFEIVSNYGTGGDPRARGRRTADQPAFTVTGKISRNRLRSRNGTEGRLSSAQSGVLQTFPLDYPWSGRNVAQQIGNAIPPLLALHVLVSALGLSGVELKEAVEVSRRPWFGRRDLPAKVMIRDVETASL